jgi:hypothetical protein
VQFLINKLWLLVLSDTLCRTSLFAGSIGVNIVVNAEDSSQSGADNTAENLAYIRQMLAELRTVAEREGADMLCYLIEMAYVEAGDIQTGRRNLSFSHNQRNPTRGVPV